MFGIPGHTAQSKTTSYKVVLPFYFYAAVAFLGSMVLLLFSTDTFTGHYFHPQILALTHTLTLGWGTMIIFGASHQLLPVLIEGRLYSEKLAYLTFFLAAAGIPLLVYGFFTFNMETPAKWGGRLVLLALLMYIINTGASIAKSKGRHIHAVFVFTAAFWLFGTAFFGLFLVYNFNTPLLPGDPLQYLPLHANTGIIGWFLLLVTGVGTRLIPMFLISKYTNVRLLWGMYALINTGLLSYLLLFFVPNRGVLILIPAAFIVTAGAFFIYYCFQSARQRIRRQVDAQMKMTLLSLGLLLLPVAVLITLIAMLSFVAGDHSKLVLCYGFFIFCGWLTAIIFGMTFKTLPFIVWNKVYHHCSASGKTPNPRDLFRHSVFKIMSVAYLAGFVLFAAGIMISASLLLKAGAVLLTTAAILYTVNVCNIIWHKPVIP